MRISTNYQTIIKENTLKIFGYQSKVYLFGSRIDNSKRGGDIDLYIIPEIKENLYPKKIEFLTTLTLALGDQKIDVVIAKDNSQPIEKIAIRDGIEL